MIDLAPLVRLGLLLVRPGFLMVGAPAFGGAFAPAHVKIGLTLLLAMALMPSTAVPLEATVTGIALVVAREAAIGLALAMAIRALLSAVELAGQLSGFQIGLSYSATIDPQSGVRNNLIAMLYANMALMTFFLLNGHHAFLRALRDSYETLPIGRGGVSEGLPEAVIALLGLVFILGTRLAAPLVLVLVLCELAMALVARSAPMLNLMAVGAPVRLMVGLLLLGLAASAVTGLVADVSGQLVLLGERAAGSFR